MFKEFWQKTFPKLIELVIVIVLGGLIGFFVSKILGAKAFLGNAVVSIIFYYFAAIIRPYIMEVDDKIVKSTKKNKK